jgi:uncharacterized membrane protein YczE
MSENEEKQIPWLLWPFYAIWRIVSFVFELTGRIICALIGLALMAAGVAITVTVVAAPVGIPIAAFGFLLLVRALF